MATSSSLTRAAALDAGEWRVLIEAATLITLLRIVLLVMPVRRVVPWCTAVRTTEGRAPAAMPGPPARLDDVDIPRFVRLVEAAARRVPGSRCLARSLTLTRMLAVRGISSDLRLGVRTENGRLTAHAWVERLGQPLNDSADVTGQYEPLDARLPIN